MEFMRSQVFCVFVTVFAVLFCEDLAYGVEGDIILRIANVGDDITLSCNRPGHYYNKWYRNETLIANWVGVFVNDPRFTRGVAQYGYPSNNITISNIRMNDSATFQCRNFHDLEIQSYDLRVIEKVSSDKDTRDGNITMILVILGSVFTLTLIVNNIIIIVLRYKQTKDRQENKHIGNASIKNEHPELCYESVEDGSRKGQEYATSIRELRETSLDHRSTDHADKKEHPEVGYESIEDGFRKGQVYATSIRELRETSLNQRSADHADKKEHLEVCYKSIEYGSRKGPEYVTSIMELKETNLESKSTLKDTDKSSNSDHLYVNSVIIPQHRQNRDTLQQGNQYENVKMIRR